MKNIKAITKEYDIAHHFGFTLLCWMTIIGIPFWFYCYAANIKDWFKHADNRQKQKQEHWNEYFYFRDIYANQILDKLLQDGLITISGNKLIGYYNIKKFYLDWLYKNKVITEDFIRAYNDNPKKLIDNWESYIIRP